VRGAKVVYDRSRLAQRKERKLDESMEMIGSTDYSLGYIRALDELNALPPPSVDEITEACAAIGTGFEASELVDEVLFCCCWRGFLKCSVYAGIKSGLQRRNKQGK